ncbi:MAG: hypothetical protein LIO80_03385 [Lachnospiraceae bacterium]|nr:hypothetical protein [Lachnospiraceae bacterium]
MDIAGRKELVAKLLSASQKRSAQEAEKIRQEPHPSLKFIYEHLRNYVLSKFMLTPDCETDDIKDLASLSLARTMKLDPDVIHSLDQATPCDHATSESAKKVLLLYAVQKDLELKPDAEKISKVSTVTELAEYVYAAL